MIDYRARRLELGKTQAEVAREVGVSLSGYRLWELQVSTPTEENKKKLHKALHLDDKEPSK